MPGTQLWTKITKTLQFLVKKYSKTPKKFGLLQLVPRPIKKKRQEAISKEWKKAGDSRPAQPYLDHLFSLIKTSFKDFVQDERNRKVLTAGQGEDKKLAKFLAIPDIYEIIKPHQLMEKALRTDNMADVKALGLFIITNFGTEYNNYLDPNKSMNAMFATIMKSFTAENAADDDYTPKDYQSARKQRKFSTAVASLVLTRTNPLKLDEKLLINITAAAQYDPKDHLTRYSVFNGLVQLVYAITEKFFTIPNYWNLTDSLHTEHVEAFVREEVGVKAYQEQFEKPYWDDQDKREKWIIQRQQFVREREVSEALNLNYPAVANRILEIAKQRGIPTPHFNARVTFEKEKNNNNALRVAATL